MDANTSTTHKSGTTPSGAHYEQTKTTTIENSGTGMSGVTNTGYSNQQQSGYTTGQTGYANQSGIVSDSSYTYCNDHTSSVNRSDLARTCTKCITTTGPMATMSGYSAVGLESTAQVHFVGQQTAATLSAESAGVQVQVPAQTVTTTLPAKRVIVEIPERQVQVSVPGRTIQLENAPEVQVTTRPVIKAVTEVNATVSSNVVGSGYSDVTMGNNSMTTGTTTSSTGILGHQTGHHHTGTGILGHHGSHGSHSSNTTSSSTSTGADHKFAVTGLLPGGNKVDAVDNNAKTGHTIQNA